MSVTINERDRDGREARKSKDFASHNPFYEHAFSVASENSVKCTNLKRDILKVLSSLPPLFLFPLFPSCHFSTRFRSRVIIVH